MANQNVSFEKWLLLCNHYVPCDLSVICLTHPAFLIDQSQRRGSLQDKDTLKSVSWWQPQLMLQSHTGIQCWYLLYSPESLPFPVTSSIWFPIAHTGFCESEKDFFWGERDESLVLLTVTIITTFLDPRIHSASQTDDTWQWRQS